MIIRRPSKQLPREPRKPSGTADHNKMYNSKRWRDLRLILLRTEPLCRRCKNKGVFKIATVADHIEPSRITDKNFYDLENLQPLCERCHAIKSNEDKKKYGEGGI